MANTLVRNVALGAGIVAVSVALAGGAALIGRPGGALAETTAAPPPAVPVSVALVESKAITPSDAFSGRLEAIERVEIRSRVAGAVQQIQFREGALVNKGDLLVRIDPSLYAAEVDRAQAQLSAARARVVFTKADVERSQQLSSSSITQREVDNRLNAYREAEANLRSAEAALKTAELNLSYTEISAPVSGRVGKVEITVGNLIAAGPNSPLLTTLVSVNPIYASFNADEQVVTRALKTLADENTPGAIERIPVEMTTVAGGAPVRGKMQFIDNQVDPRSGTVRVRAVFDNADGRLMPGQFARLSVGQPKPEAALLVSERAVGTDQNKKFVMVVDAQNHAEYREVTLGASVDGLRVVASGLRAGERIVVNGLQRVRPGVTIKPETVAMEAAASSKTVAQN
ncbi:efflux RND transporter periplasmic adaptor subunit [Rhodopseudomonas palustris]|jgi:multidrug efflux system membrane fusion protein|uniref:Efflux RND transporter periplasmic adaptor subunit n=1 Tax=Rhodopseudomonas palustris (strain ATCC BAA-98 / CGA009) TaxID=258594 RepID=Q6N5F9_RHOPA|nr:efflux RND transporter periplasmic adaptor subunit [Rhodopseudomonas palustris]OPF93612.1 MexE family multidrug efflux RND transporter periplasmic adaptor subunit [Rhodopseudomonas palustris]WAB75935.1 efflux RND transporter periplasmic adaptor subunit [Rhodopseudomonas palustris]WCL93186.1 efflux RND transporter periplasmic adaptor subunit [Rhodopseudomonas palustris CGA009]WND49845.1 efflux RND transporter periplasmic adaptor subunit [Rhodopseudomonas palustris]CAE28461.1 RND multidrug ef